MRLLVSHASPGIMNTLRIQRPDAERTGSLNSLFAGQSDGAVLYYITALHLGDVLIPWTSATYHNLVDLRLQFRHKPETISTSQLTSILAASPGLTSLKLEHLFIVPSEDRNEEKIVRLVHLEVLYLNHMNKDSLASLMSIVSLSNCLAILEVGIHRCGDGYSEEIVHLAQDFLRGVRIKTLALTSDLHYNDGAQWALSLSKMIPFLENLVLDTLSLYDVRGPGETTDEPETNVGTTSYLPNLFLMAHELDLEKLKLIVSVYGVETLYLRRTWDGSADELKAPLLESCHNLTCVILDEDPTINWPCRTMFDW
ncbi:hypothetical protein FRC12_021765 [Ceratobasidium sp. 428]|nr:hypothetical protein FRC12_021765 [Ceratobasidium sp. 428]